MDNVVSWAVLTFGAVYFLVYWFLSYVKSKQKEKPHQVERDQDLIF